MYLYGAGGHGKAVLDMIISDCGLKVLGVFDDNDSSDILGFSVEKMEFLKFSHKDDFHISIGNNEVRKKISQFLSVNYPKLIHPSSLISKYSEIGIGTVVMGNASIKAVTTIGKHCIINAGAVIGHDVIIEDYVHIAPNSSIAGFVTIKEGVHFGIGASIIQGVTIGKWAVIGAGAVIIKDAPDYSVVVGNPGKIIKFVNNHSITTP